MASSVATSSVGLSFTPLRLRKAGGPLAFRAGMQGSWFSVEASAGRGQWHCAGHRERAACDRSRRLGKGPRAHGARATKAPPRARRRARRARARLAARGPASLPSPWLGQVRERSTGKGRRAARACRRAARRRGSSSGARRISFRHRGTPGRNLCRRCARPRRRLSGSSPARRQSSRPRSRCRRPPPPPPAPASGPCPEARVRARFR